MTCSVSTREHQLHFLFPFRIAHGVRLTTAALRVYLHCGSFISEGEATFPPYLPETAATANDFIHKVSWDLYLPGMDPRDFYPQIKNTASGNYFAKAALDMALWNAFPAKNDCFPKATCQPLSFYTLAVCTNKEMSLRFQQGIQHGFRCFKIKLDGKNDHEMIENFRKISDHAFAVDANSSWTSVEQGMEMADFLHSHGCMFIEQPFSPGKNHWSEELKHRNILPVIADESLQTESDLEEVEACFNGGNIKLLKCGGLTPAIPLAEKMKERGMKILIGCMSESKIGCDAAALLAGYADWLDLDGPYLTREENF